MSAPAKAARADALAVADLPGTYVQLTREDDQ